MRLTYLFVLLLNIAQGDSFSLELKTSSPKVRFGPSKTPELNPRKSSLFASSAATSMRDKKEEWTKPRLHNTSAFRSIAILGVLAAAGASTKTPLGPQSNAAVHLLSFATWFGTMAYTTFVVGITAFKNLDRQTFGKLQAKLFPKYFGLSSIAIVLQLITLKGLSSGLTATGKSTKALGIALVVTLLNQFVLEPIATENMMRRYDLENSKQQDSDEYKNLKKSFGKLHGISSLVNLIALCAAAAHGFFLSAALI